MGLLDQASVSLARAGERARFVAEKLGLEQLPRQRRTVDLDHRTGGATAVVMQDSSGQALSGAGLTADHEGAEGYTAELCEQLAHFLRLRTRAHEGVDGVDRILETRRIVEPPLRTRGAHGATHDEVEA